MKKLLAFGLLALLAALLIRTWLFVPPALPARATSINTEWDARELAEVLAGALRYRTVSNIDAEKVDRQAFSDFQHYLQSQFPLVFSRLSSQLIKDDTLLLRWPGSNKELKPILLLAHQDVVPVIPGTEAEWSYPPYGGTIADGYIWGRGAIDDKASVIGILQAVERALSENFTPDRTIYLAFGDDEEVGGTGAMAVAALLKKRGESLAFVLDEGGIIAKGLVPGMTSRVALVGPGEKGYISLKLSARKVGGHASMPPANTAAGIIGRAVARLEEQPFPADIDLTVDLFRFLGDELPYWQRLLFANSWLFSPLLESVLSDDPATNAGIRTTTAVTMLQGSVKDNVLPIEASAVVNFRIFPGESIASVREQVVYIIDDERVTIENYGFGSEPSAVATTDSSGFKVLSEIIRQVSPDVVVAPRLVVAATDARHFEEIADNSYRFLGVEVGPHELRGIHGTDERVSVQSYAEAVKIYYQLILRSAEL